MLAAQTDELKHHQVMNASHLSGDRRIYSPNETMILKGGVQYSLHSDRRLSSLKDDHSRALDSAGTRQKRSRNKSGGRQHSKM